MREEIIGKAFVVSAHHCAMLLNCALRLRNTN